MKKKITACCCCLLLSGCLAKYSDYTKSSVAIAEADTNRINAINTGLKDIATALVSNIGSQIREDIVGTQDLNVSVNQTGAEWIARLQIAREMAEAYKAAVMHRPVMVSAPITGERIGLEVAGQATALTGIIGGVVGFSKAMRPAANLQQTAAEGGTIGSGAGTNAPTTSTETTIGGQE